MYSLVKVCLLEMYATRNGPLSPISGVMRPNHLWWGFHFLHYQFVWRASGNWKCALYSRPECITSFKCFNYKGFAMLSTWSMYRVMACPIASLSSCDMTTVRSLQNLLPWWSKEHYLIWISHWCHWYQSHCEWCHQMSFFCKCPTREIADMEYARMSWNGGGNVVPRYHWQLVWKISTIS